MITFGSTIYMGVGVYLIYNKYIHNVDLQQYINHTKDI